MQENQNLTGQYLQILQIINKHLNRQEFCELHGISQSKLSRILAGKTQPSLNLLDYMCMYAGLKIKLELV